MPSRRLKVLLVAPHSVHGGQEEWLLQQLEATDRLLVDVLVLQEGPLRAVLEKRNLKVDVLPVGSRPAELVLPILRLAARLRARRPDVVVANGVKAQFVAGPAAWLAGVPQVFVRHDHAFETMVSRLARFADGVVGTSAEVLTAVARPDAEVVPPPRPKEPLDRHVARTQLIALGLPPSATLVVGMLARLVAAKGVEDAIRALALPDAGDWQLAVLGGEDPSEPDERQRLHRLARELGVVERVHLLGFAETAAQIVGGFDALAVLTRNGGPRGSGGEGFGMSALEASIARVPVITVEGGAVASRLGRRAGIEVPSANPEAIAAALKILSNMTRRQELGDAGRELALRHPDAKETAQRLCGALAAAARRPGAALVCDDPVSVIVPVFNEEDEIAPLISQLVPQLGVDDELIMVDDASSDRTFQRLEELKRHFPHIVVESLPRNRGAAAARNAGVKMARHEFIVVTDAGNEIPSGWLDGMRSALADATAPDLVAGCYQVSERTSWERAMAVALYPDVDDVRQPTPLVRLYSRVFGKTFSASRPIGRSLAFRREAWGRVGGFREDLRWAEDTAFGLSVAQEGRCVIQTDAPVVWYQHPRVAATARMYASYGRGDGVQGERVVVMRNGVRAAAALLAPVLLLAGGRVARTAVVAGGAAYLSLPLRKLYGKPGGLRTATMVPIALAVKDLAKAFGCVHGLREARQHGAAALQGRGRRGTTVR